MTYHLSIVAAWCPTILCIAGIIAGAWIMWLILPFVAWLSVCLVQAEQAMRDW